MFSQSQPNKSYFRVGIHGQHQIWYLRSNDADFEPEIQVGIIQFGSLKKYILHLQRIIVYNCDQNTIARATVSFYELRNRTFK